MTGARLVVAVLTAAAAFMAGRTLLVSDVATAAPARLELPPLPAEGRRDLAIRSVEGSVESGAAATGFAPVREGGVLPAGQTLRVGGGAKATLRLGVASHLTLSPGSELTAVELTPTSLTLRLESGKLAAELREPGRTLRISSSEGAEVLALGTASTRFLVAAHPGRLAVINAEGAEPVKMIAAGEAVPVPERRVSWSVRGAVPRPPIEPPNDPGLEITSVTPAPPPAEDAAADDAKATDKEAVAEGTEAAAAAIVIRGHTHPLSLLKMDGVVVEVAADGSFEITAPKKREPTQLLASLPTGDEALLEVPAASDGSDEKVDEQVDEQPSADEAAEKAAADKLAGREAPPAAPVVEQPPAKPKPKPRVKRKTVKRQKKARPQRRAQKSPKPNAPAKKKAGVVTWGAAP